MDYQIKKSVNEFTNTVSRSLPEFKPSSEIRLMLAQESSPNGETIRLYFEHEFGDLGGENRFMDYEERICFQNGFVIIRLNDLENIKLTFQEKDKVDSWSARISGSIVSYQGESNYVILNEETLKKISCSHSVAMYIEGTGTRRYRLNASDFKNFNVYCKTLYDELNGTNADNVTNDTPTENEGYTDNPPKKTMTGRGFRKNTISLVITTILFLLPFIILFLLILHDFK